MDISAAKRRTLYYGWIIVIASLVMGIIGFGIRYSFGIFFTSLETEFGLSRAATSGIYSTYMFLGGVLSILGGWALDKYGPKKVSLVMSLFTGLSLLASSQVHSPWQLYLTYGGLQALGTGALFAVVSSTASRWFIKKRGLVIGITSAAGAIGEIILAPLSSLLILHFNWRIAFIILGLTVWIILIPISQLMKRDPSDIGLLPDGVIPERHSLKSSGAETATTQNGLLLREAYKIREFWFLGFMWLLSGISSQMILTHIVPHALDLGISPINTPFIISSIGVGAIVGRIIDGKLSDSIGRKSLAIISAVLQVATLISLIFIREVWQFYVVGLLFGYGWGGLNTEIVLLISDIFGLRGIGAIMGATVAGFNFGSAIGPAIGGIVFDATGSYSPAFAFAALGMAIATVLGVLIRPTMAKMK
jgi:MFS family permease